MRIALIACALLLSTFFTANVSANQTDAEFREHYAAALQGQSNSQLIIGRILLEGGGSVRQDVPKSRIFLDRSIKAGNGAAAKYTAQQYENGKLLGKNLDKALKYYKEAKRLGVTGLDGTILKLTETQRGSHSREACIQYGTNDKSRARDLAICAEKGFISADASKYWLWVYEKGDAEAFIKAATTRLNTRGAAYDPQSIITGFPKFFVDRASDAQKDALKALIRDLGFGGLDCASGQDAFGFVKDPDVVGCLVSAAGGDADAAPQASKWWRNGEHGLIRNEAYADYLLDGLLQQPPGGGNGDGPALANLCVALESDPKKHFQMLKEYLGANPFNLESVAACLQLEMELIASGRVPEFATGAAEVAWVLEHVDWNLLPPDLIARTLIKLMTDYKNVASLKTDAVLGNINRIQFGEPWIDQFRELDPAMDKSISKAMIGKYLANSCDAVRYVLFNPQSADWDQYFGLQNLTKCIPFDGTTILQVANTDTEFARRLLSSFVMIECEAVVFAQQNTNLADMDVLSISPIFQQCLADIPKGKAPNFADDPKGASLYLLSRFVGSKENQCEPFFNYWMNRDTFNRFIAEDQRPQMVLAGYDSVEFCSSVDGDMAGLLATDHYKGGKWNDAYELAEKACDLLHYPSCGLQAHLIRFKSIKAVGGLDGLAKKKKATRIAERGYQLSEQQDPISGLILNDVMRSGLLGGQSKDADKHLSSLLAKGFPGADLRKAELCFKKLSPFTKCSRECSVVDRLIRDGQLDYLSQEKALYWQKNSKCN